MIDSKQHASGSLIGSLWQARNLLMNLVRRDMTVRYRATVLGLLWSLAKPLAYMGIYYVVFGRLAKLSLGTDTPYELHVLIGILCWTFFIGAVSEAMYSILGHASLIRKVKLPLEVFPAAAVLSHAIHFGLALVVVVFVMLFYGITPGPLFLLVPFIFLIQAILIQAMALLLAALNVFYRDVASVWEVLSAGWFYATPIVYGMVVSLPPIQRKLGQIGVWAYLANPMTPITIAYRRVLLFPLSETNLEIPDSQLIVFIALTAISSLIFLWIARRIFLKLSLRFADEL